MTAPDTPMLPPDEAAAEWFALKRSGEMTAGQLLEFQEWLEASPDHQAAWDEAEQSWTMAGLLRQDPELLLLRANARRAYPPFRRPLIAAGAAAAAPRGARRPGPDRGGRSRGVAAAPAGSPYPAACG